MIEIRLLYEEQLSLQSNIAVVSMSIYRIQGFSHFGHMKASTRKEEVKKQIEKRTRKMTEIR
jgi:hypothetical protein